MIKDTQDAIRALRKRFPRFQKYVGDDDRMSYDNDLPYLLFGDFSLFLRRKLTQLSRQQIARDRELLEGFRLIGDMLKAGRPDLNDLVGVGILENLTDCPMAAEIARDQLDPEVFAVYEALTK